MFSYSMIYLIITASIKNKSGSRNAEHRKNRYIDSITQLLSLIQTDASIKPTKNLIRPADSHSSGSMTTEDLHPSPEGADLNLQRVKPIIVENNGLRETYLDGLSCDVVYTNNNRFNFRHKGVNELLDIKEVINKYNIQDDDVVIKLTGRYKVLDTTFIELVKNNSDLYDAFVKFFNVFTKEYMFDDCVLGLFAIKCKYLKNFEYKCIKSAECEFADHVRQNVNKIMEIADLKLDCCFAEGLRMLIV